MPGSEIDRLKCECEWSLLDIGEFFSIGVIAFCILGENAVYESDCFPVHPCQQDFIVRFWSFANLMDEKWYLGVVLIFIFLISESKHYFIV